jgi:SAM-dependent methyltransferase
MDDVSDIAVFYNTHLENEHTRLERHQLEHELTWRYLKRFLPAQGNILEVGAATRRYTVELARQEYLVTAVDLSASLMAACQQRLSEAGLEKRAQLILADARDLSAVSRRDFDAALLMGPLYHLVFEADRKLALQGVFDRLKEGGVIFSAFISRYGILGDLIKKMPDWIELQDEVRSVMEHGRDPDNPRTGAFRGYFARLDEIAPLHEAIGFQTIAIAGVEPAISADDESYNQLQGRRRELWLDLFEELSLEESLIGASRHLLYIGKKARAGDR